MKYIKKIFYPIIYVILFILISCFIITTLNYFDILGYKLTIYLKLILSIMAFIIGGFKIGVISNKKGWLEGIKFGLILIIIMSLLTLLFNDYKYRTVIFYTILLFSSIVGSMTGITKNKKLK